MVLRVGGSAIAVSALLLANGATDVIDQLDIWKAVCELGIAVVFAVLGFLGMGWWIRKRGVEQREDLLRMAHRIDTLENFQQNELLELTRAATASITASIEATRENTAQLLCVSHTLAALANQLAGRPCAALESLPPADRAAVQQMLRGKDTQ